MHEYNHNNKSHFYVHSICMFPSRVQQHLMNDIRSLAQSPTICFLLIVSLCISDGTIFGINHIEPVRHIVNPIRMTSLAASDEFMDHSLDFVFLDASHEYKDVKDDIEHWLPKVKIGGTLGGDDMNWKGVRRAVEDTLTNFEDHGRYWTYKNETF